MTAVNDGCGAGRARNQCQHCQQRRQCQQWRESARGSEIVVGNDGPANAGSALLALLSHAWHGSSADGGFALPLCLLGR
jgi:hypothetical protein